MTATATPAMAANPPRSAMLPTSTPQSNVSEAPNPPSAFRAFFAGISDTVRAGLSNNRPWSDLLDRSGFGKPDSVSDATQRIRKNYNYYRVNYLIVVTAVIAISLLTHPFSLLLLAALLAAWLFLYLFRQPSDPPVTLFGRQFSDREMLFVLLISTIIVIFLTSVGTVLVSALMVGVAIVCAHGAFRVPEDLFLDEPEPQNGAVGFLSFLTGGAPNVVQAPMATRA